MIAISTVEWLFGLLVLIVFTNRYVLGSLLRVLDRRPQEGYNVDPPHWPTVAIVVPVFCEGPSVLQTAASFAALDYPRDKLKIVFVDDCSTDDTLEHLQEACRRYPWMELIQNPHNMGKRLGIKNAVLDLDTDLVMSVDSDVIVDSNVVSELVRHMYTTGADAVGGCVFVSNAKETWLTRMQAVKYWVGYHYLKNVENAFSHVMCLSGCLTLYKREAMLAVDKDVESRTFLGDEVKYGEDRFLTRKIVERGYRTRLCFTARCFTKAPTNMPAYLNQQLRWRRSNMIDLITAIPHLHKFNLLVLIHYISMGTLLFFYPIFLLSKTMELQFVMPMLFHALVVTIFAVAYELTKHRLPEFAQTSGIWFIVMAAVFPVVYLTMTPLGLFTLGTTSWETRGGKKSDNSGISTEDSINIADLGGTPARARKVSA
ncbi:glycosyltransferase [Pseudahrensia aquimaris]|uniref:Glycosyltransferase n=1 Tax=Pseudahrensia aquimaris TaxID=744461 RepID=A0ABW3FER1_9HYPH